MFIRNFLKRGNYLTLVPFGLHMTVQYGDGMVEKLYTGFHNDLNQTDITDTFLTYFLDNDIVPRTIPIKDGTSWVSGILYTGKNFNDSGRLPYCIFDSIISDFLLNPSHYNFFAGSVDSYGLTFNNAIQRKNWLSIAKFKVLPGLVFNSSITEENFGQIINTYSENFSYPYFSDYLEFVNGQCVHHNLDFSQDVVTDVTIFTDEYGIVLASVKTVDSELVILYEELIENHIVVNTVLFIDESGGIITCYNNEKCSKNVKSYKSCKECGAPIGVDTLTGHYKCTNNFCRSGMYPKVDHFLKIQHLPSLTYDQYKLIESEHSGCIYMLDVLRDEKYSNLELSCSLETFLRSMISYVLLGPSSTIIGSICSACNNSVSTFLYFLDGRMHDLLVDLNAPKRLVDWFDDIENIYELKTVLSKFEIVEQNRKFEGSPIFRNQTICITGKFLHGSRYEVMSILRSYSADVVEEYSDSVNYLLVGDIKEDINGYYIRRAKDSRIPVLSESEFFSLYEIDTDLEQNLI